MTGFDSKRQASKSLLEQALDALELARDAHCLPGPVNTLVYQSIRSISAELAQPNKWRDAIDDALICTMLGTADSFPDAKFALDLLISWHVQVALDPEVSSSAQALIDRGRAAVAEPVAYGMRNDAGKIFDCIAPDERARYLGDYNVPLYAAPQAVAEPLTNEKISACSKGHMTRNGFARAIEAAHGIKGSAA